MRRPTSLALAAAAAGVALCPGAATAASCAGRLPRAVTLHVAADGSAARVAWRPPAHRAPRLAFRVARDGAVVGQTGARSLRVSLAPSRRTAITVTAVVGGRLTGCSVTRVVAGTGSAPAQVAGVRTRLASAGRAVVLSWEAAAPGAHPVTGYRVVAGVRTLKVTRPTLRLRLPRKAAEVRVLAFDDGGRSGPPSAPVVLRAGHRAPTAPVAPAVSLLTPTTGTLTWGASRATGTKLAGYRLLRDGRTVDATPDERFGLADLRREAGSYRVVAVDALGWTSASSDPVQVAPGATPPPAPRTPAPVAPAPPAGPRVAPGIPGAPQPGQVTDTQVALSWTPADLPPGSQLRGYRIMRDGDVVTQVPSVSATIGGLAPRSAHDWTVAAVDTQGLASAPSPATRVLQADPPSPTGRMQAYLLASTDASFADFREHYQQVSVVYPTYFDCQTTGAIAGADNRQIDVWAQDRRVKVLPRYNCQRTLVVHRILTEPALREQWIGRMVADAVAGGWDGVNLDLETAPATDRDALTSFVADLADRLHAQGKLLSQAVSAKTADVPNHPRSTAFDYASLVQHDDWVFVMAWGIHWATSTPGPQDDMAWVQQVRNYVASVGHPEKFVMGTMLYGMDWPSGGGTAHPADGRTYDELQALAARPGAVTTYDAVRNSYRVLYTDDAGVPHELWYSDATAVGDRVALAVQAGMQVGLWRVGQEDERIWSDPRLPQATG